ncbi:MAG TPA: GyrI-like domain-containing protein [Thermoleophilaceae bacterium]|jgi:AraC family transcriptional regulator
MHELEIRELTAQPAAVEHSTSPSDDLGSAIDTGFPALFGRLAKLGVEPAGPPFVRYLETGDNFTIELGVPVPTALADGKQTSLPAGRAAVWRHVGPYSELRTACERLGAAVEELGEEPSGPLWESYVTNPAEEPEPSKRITEIYLPLR